MNDNCQMFQQTCGCPGLLQWDDLFFVYHLSHNQPPGHPESWKKVTWICTTRVTYFKVQQLMEQGGSGGKWRRKICVCHTNAFASSIGVSLWLFSYCAFIIIYTINTYMHSTIWNRRYYAWLSLYPDCTYFKLNFWKTEICMFGCHLSPSKGESAEPHTISPVRKSRACGFIVPSFTSLQGPTSCSCRLEGVGPVHWLLTFMLTAVHPIWPCTFVVVVSIAPAVLVGDPVSITVTLDRTDIRTYY